MLVKRQSIKTSESTASVRGVGASVAGFLGGGCKFDHAPSPSDDSSAPRVVDLVLKQASSRFSKAILAYIAAPITNGTNLLTRVSAFSSVSSNVVISVGFVDGGIVDVAKSKAIARFWYSLTLS